MQGRDLGAVAADVDSRLKQMQFPLEYHAEVLGDYAGQQAAQLRLLALAIAAAIGIFLLLQAAYRELAPGAAVIPDLARGAGGRGAGGALHGGIISLGIAGRFAGGAGDRGAQPDRADQALSPSRYATKANPLV